VKLQFFKSFILPYFDYGMSLSIYYHKTAIQKLSKAYYFCLFKLFGYKFVGKTHEEIANELSKDNLTSFSHRLTSRLLIFVHKSRYDTRGPQQLREWLQPVTLNNSRYNLRTNNKITFVASKSSTKYGDLTFSNFLCNYLNKINFLSFNTNLKKFEEEITQCLNNLLSIFIYIIPKFNTHLNFYFYFCN